MIVAADVYYGDGGGRAAAVAFHHWTDSEPAATYTAVIGEASPYRAGSFYLRELPALLGVLGLLPREPEVIIVDGYVWLEDGEPGLGARLRKELGGRPAVIGVAKKEFQGAPAAEVYRGRSRRPLFVTAAGIPVDVAAVHIAEMHGRHRIPDLLRLADAFSRHG